MKTLPLIALTIVSLLHLGTAAPSLEALAEKALLLDPDALVSLRKAGPAGLEALLHAGRTQVSSLKEGYAALDDPKSSRLREACDKVAAQRDAYASGLYWFTDFEQAKAEAKRSHRRILSLRLLGRLDEELSCANSRFFRTVLYANMEVSHHLRQHYVLHWQSLRPVPVITIDMGDGRRLQRTITGNSAHYVLNESGQVVDVLPGLYGPAAFLQALAKSEVLKSGSKKDLLAWHEAEASRLDAEWRKAMPSASVTPSVAGPSASPSVQPFPATFSPAPTPSDGFFGQPMIFTNFIAQAGAVAGSATPPVQPNLSMASTVVSQTTSITTSSPTLPGATAYNYSFASAIAAQKQPVPAVAASRLTSAKVVGERSYFNVSILDSRYREEVDSFFASQQPRIELPSAATMPGIATGSTAPAPLISASNTPVTPDKLSPSDWERLGERYLALCRLDECSRVFMMQKLGPGYGSAEDRIKGAVVAPDSPFGEVLARFEKSLSADTAINELRFHRELHRWLCSADAESLRDVTTLNSRVYDELFLTSDKDPWLGLSNEGIYNALEHSIEFCKPPQNASR